MKQFWWLCLLLTGCATAAYSPARIDRAYPPRTEPAKIELFRTASPTKKFEELGVVTVCCTTDANEATSLLREKASDQGGDALIGIELNADGTGTATVIRYL